MKKNIILLFTFIFLITFIDYTNASEREIKSLNGQWNFCIDSLNNGINNSYFNSFPKSADKVKVPHTWNISKKYSKFFGKAWYQKSIKIPNSFKGKDIRIKFHAVNRNAIIYLNGEKIAEHLNSGFTSFTVNLTDKVKYGKKNNLVISVDNKPSKNTLPYADNYICNNDGGIIRDVELIAAEKPAVKYAHIRTLNTGKGAIDISIYNTSHKKVVCSVEISEKNSGKIVFSKKSEYELNNNYFNVPFVVENPKLWHFDHPNLYNVKISTSVNEKEKDIFYTRFGYKRVTIFKPGEMLLNDEPIRLIGINWLPGNNPEMGLAETHEEIDKQLSKLKNANGVITRFSWQQDEYLLNKCDEMGILVQEEIPWYKMPTILSPKITKVALQHIDEMINQDYNHACIFSWGISQDLETTKEKEPDISIINHILALDPTRFTEFTSSNLNSTNQWNDRSLTGTFPTWNDNFDNSPATKKYTNIADFLIKNKNCLHNAPTMISAFGTSIPKDSDNDFERSEKITEHLNQYRQVSWVWSAIFNSLNDTRKTSSGLCTETGEKKPSYYTFRKEASPLVITKIKNTGNSLVVTLLNRNTMPCYKVSGYYIMNNGEKINIPDMKPGENKEIILSSDCKNISIYRPGGYIVLKHKLF